MRKSVLLVLVAALAAPAFATPAPDLTVGFSPSDGRSALQVVLGAIKGARQGIDVAVYSFTSKPVATALADAGRRGVAVRVVADEKANSDRYTAVTFLANQGVPVRLNDRYAIMHNKFMVIDGVNVETGSFNYTASAASRNAENALLIENAPQLADAYRREFDRLWREATPLKARY